MDSVAVVISPGKNYRGLMESVDKIIIVGEAILLMIRVHESVHSVSVEGTRCEYEILCRKKKWKLFKICSWQIGRSR